MKFNPTLPSFLKEPTGWVITLLVLGFMYVQWPTRNPPIPETIYVWQTLDSGFNVAWEAEPLKQHNAHPEVWGLSRKGMSFLVQTDALTGTFNDLVLQVAEQDRATVGGAVQEPMQITATTASYAFFDAESRVQAHRWYLSDNQWIKVSVLYKPSSDTRKERAEVFLTSAGF